ncbi:MAG: glycoside hydrolase family 10 protein [Rhodothermales bacterium]
MRSLVIPLVLVLVGLSGCSSSESASEVMPPTATPTTTPVPEVEREFRGVWIATVANIDWPSEPGLPVAQQQAEFRHLVDQIDRLGFNAIVLQVRPTADALYASKLEPWSAYLTGQQGQAPSPYYDPLAFAVEEAHKRGIELHAWFNPYRAFHPSAQGTQTATHMSQRRPDLVKTYGDLQWFDPGEPDAAAHSLAVMLDVVERYDIDGVHLDDYFYPYPITDSLDQDVPFPDDPSWAKAQAAGTTLSRDDWRRKNIDDFVERLYLSIKATKPHVKFGISPFGIWRPGHPPQIQGFDQYDKLYADAKKWLNKGWIDYYTPQLYWAIEQTAQSYPVLLDWWIGENTHGRHMWPGQYTSRVGFAPERAWAASEVTEQIRLTRERTGATGTVHFSMQAIEKNANGIADALAETYAAPALVPASPWLDPAVPSAPAVALVGLGGTPYVEMTPADAVLPAHWIVHRYRPTGGWSTELLPGWHTTYDLTDPTVTELAVAVVSRVGVEGPPTRVMTSGVVQ